MHYDTCLRARILSLNDVFQAKLGWLVGNMYSRVGTEDWVPTHETKKDFERRIHDLLDRACKWEDDKRLLQAKTSMPTGLLAAGQEAIRNHIAGVNMPNQMDEVIEAVLRQLKKLTKVSDDADAEKIRNRLRNDPIVSRLKNM